MFHCVFNCNSVFEIVNHLDFFLKKNLVILTGVLHGSRVEGGQSQ